MPESGMQGIRYWYSLREPLMPRPLYILCAQSFAINQDTNTLSVFHILESLNTFIGLQPSPGETVVSHERFAFVGFAAWRRGEGEDSDQEYEFEILLKRPDQEQPVSMTPGTFKFTMPNQRFNVHFAQMEPFTQSGDLVFTSRIRPVGTTEWLTQDYPIRVDVHRPSQPSSEPAISASAESRPEE